MDELALTESDLHTRPLGYEVCQNNVNIVIDKIILI